MGTHYTNDGKAFYVDDQDDAFVRSRRWGTTTLAGRKSTSYIRTTSKGHQLLHRLLLCAPKGVAVDHADGDPFNNRRSNLRFATLSQNAQNRRQQRNNTSGCTGVTWHKRSCKWQASIKANRRTRYLGYFASLEAASAAYQRAAQELHGEFYRQAVAS